MDPSLSLELSVIPQHHTGFHDQPPLPPASPTASNHTEASSLPIHHQVASTPKAEWIQLYALFFCIYTVGWQDGTTGPLLPIFQAHYRLTYQLLSVIFVVNFVGYLVGGLCLVLVGSRVGFGKLILLAAVTSTTSYTVLSTAPPYPILLLSFALSGFGQALQASCANSFVACLHTQVPKKLGIMHALYGLGAFSAPLIATQFARIKDWNFHYIVSTVLGLLNAGILAWVFKLKKQEELIINPNPPINNDSNSTTNVDTSVPTSRTNQGQGKMWKNTSVHLLAFYTLIYVGVEVTTGGWIVTYIIRERGGGPSSGYISSGFFGGLAAGRVGLLWVNEKVGEYRIVYLYSAIILALELQIYFTHNLISNAVSVSLIGVLLGPMYPIMLHHAGRILPRQMMVATIGWIAGFGAGGSALVPFMTGALAGRFGIVALEPVLIVMIILMVVLWACVPSRDKRLG